MNSKNRGYYLLHHPITRGVLNNTFGLTDLFPIQEEVVSWVLGGGNGLVVIPTGSGKSLCFQLPALLCGEDFGALGSGITLVFSPLIALMEDQVSSLKKRGIRAEYINSTLSKRERESRYRRLAEGKYQLVYATPERMEKPEFVNALLSVPGGVKLLAVDEAHCVTKWGHDFRPAYQRVGEFRKVLGSPQTLALTATATPEVRDDIRVSLGFSEAELPLFATGIDRPNLALEMVEVWGNDEKLAAIQSLVQTANGTCIIYFTLIKHLEEFERLLEIQDNRPWNSLEVYHGRLDPREKKRVYDSFVRSAPEDRMILLATNAFGMGVDKADIRCIVHAEIPGSVESYYQEVGRAGRDGKPSRCVLLYDEKDLAVQQQFLTWMNPSAELLQEAALLFQSAGGQEIELDDLRRALTGRDRGDRRTEYCVISLEKLGVIEPTGLPFHYRYVRALQLEEISPDELAEKKERDLLRLLEMLKMAKSEDIRSFVLSYFGLDNPS